MHFDAQKLTSFAILVHFIYFVQDAKYRKWTKLTNLLDFVAYETAVSQWKG